MRSYTERLHLKGVEVRFSGSKHISRGVFPYMGYIGMFDPKEYGFSAVFVINRVSVLANFGHFCHKPGYGFCTLALIWVCF